MLSNKRINNELLKYIFSKLTIMNLSTKYYRRDCDPSHTVAASALRMTLLALLSTSPISSLFFEGIILLTSYTDDFYIPFYLTKYWCNTKL